MHKNKISDSKQKANKSSISKNKENRNHTPKRNRKKQLRLRIGIFLAVCICAAVIAQNRWEMLSYLGYPQALIEKAYRYPEARGYVLKYPFYKNRHQNIDVSGELVEGEIPLFLQWDSRWGYENYGISFIGVLGCGPTALSMVYCGLTGDASMNPYVMAGYAEENGYYVQGAGTSWDFMSTGAEKLGLTVHSIGNSKEAILNALSQQMPLISIMTPGDFTVSGHFLVLTGIDADGGIRILDPNSKEKSEKTWDIEVLTSQMAAAWAYEVR